MQLSLRLKSFGGVIEVFDTKAIYQQDYTEVELHDVPKIFQPLKVPFGLRNINQVFAAGHGRDIFKEREISKDGAIVVVRPDQYVAGIFPLDAREEISEFFAQNMLPLDGRNAGTFSSLGRNTANSSSKHSR